MFFELIFAPFWVFVSVVAISVALGKQYYWLSILAWIGALTPTLIAIFPFATFIAILIAVTIFIVTMTILGPLIGIGTLVIVIARSMNVDIITFFNESSEILVTLLAAITGNVVGFALIDKRNEPKEIVMS